jgi:hypothetical protein
MIDLPQHAAQISIWKHFDDPCYRFDQTFEFNWFTPYLFGYVLVRAAAGVLPVDAAFRLVLYLATIALPLAIRFLLRRTGADGWLSLLGFPLAFGFTFYWGFVNYVIAIPVAVVYLAAAYDLSTRPELRRGAVLVALAMLLLVSHALIFLFCAGATILLALFVRPYSRAAVVAVPAIVPIPALLWWVARMRGSDSLVAHPIGWNPGLYRLLHLPSMLLSDERDNAAVILLAVAALAIAVTRPRVARDPRRWIFFVLAAAIYFAGPQSAFGTAFVFQRFAVFTAIGALFVIDTPMTARTTRALLIVAAMAWAGLLTVRFHDFDREAAEFDRVVEAIPPNVRLAFYIAHPRAEAVPGAVFLHFPAYYQEEKGGLLSWSFASFFPQLIRYRPGAAPRLGGSVLFDPAHIDWQGLSAFDYVLIRGRRDPTLSLAHALDPIAHTRTWWLYRTPRGRMLPPRCPPLEI